MSIHNLVAELIAAGTPPQLVAAVSQCISEMATEIALLKLQLKIDDERRKRNAARMRVQRESVRTLTHSAAQDPAYTKKEESKKKTRKIYIPADFELNETDLAACQELNWIASKVASELMRFRDHAAQNGRQCADWHAAWRSWVRSPFQTPSHQPNGGTNGHHANPAAIRRTSDAVSETLARRQERFRFG